MKKINYYKDTGELVSEKCLNEENLARTNGMLLKCYLDNNQEIVGYSDPYRLSEKGAYDGDVYDYIYLWTWDNIDEEKHELIGDEESMYNKTFKKVDIEKIIKIDAILYSNPIWGGRLTNKFKFEKATKHEDHNTSIPPFLMKGSDSNDD